VKNKKIVKNNDELNSEKDKITEPNSLSYFLFKLFIVSILVAVIFYIFQEIIISFFGENVYVLIVFGICIFYFIHYLVTKMSALKK